MKLIKEHLKEINMLCDKHHVTEMHVFGSVLRNDFSPDSDIDFLVRFSSVDPLEYFDNYMDLKESLERVFSRNIDLVEVQTVKNPILERSIDRDKRIIYGRKDIKMAV